MDEDKLKGYVWFFVAGYLGAIVGAGLASIETWYWEIKLYGWSSQLILPAFLYIFVILLASIFIGVPGGFIGGLLTNKKWAAFLGGLIPNVIIVGIIVNNWYRIR